MPTHTQWPQIPTLTHRVLWRLTPTLVHTLQNRKYRHGCHKFLLQVPASSCSIPVSQIHSKRTMTWSLWSKQMKIWKFKRFAFGVQVPSMLCLYQKFTVCWVFPRKDLYESIRRPFLQGTSIMKVYVLCVYMRYMYLVTQLHQTLLWPHGL